MAEGKNLQIKRGLVSIIGTLLAGELGWATDTKVLYVGDGAANKAVLMASQASAAGLALMDDANAAAQLTTLGITASASELNNIHSMTVAGLELINDGTAAAQRATLGTAAYSEGTWTPTLNAVTVNGSAPVMTGWYRVIGNLVFVICTIAAGTGGNTSVVLTGGTSYITGLPFAPVIASPALFECEFPFIVNVVMITAGQVFLNVASVTATNRVTVSAVYLK